jgi:hypothetical protein
VIALLCLREPRLIALFEVCGAAEEGCMRMSEKNTAACSTNFNINDFSVFFGANCGIVQ